MVTIPIKPSRSHFDSFSIADANIGLELGKGKFGIVSKCEYMGKNYAIKTIPPNLKEDEKQMAIDSLRKEIKAFKKLQPGWFGHPNICRMYKSSDSRTPSKEFILFELLGDDLEKYIFKNGKKLTRHEMIKLLKELCDALIYSHGRDVIHRDLKPSNLVLSIDRDETKSLKIIDYGLGRKIADEMSHGVGTPRYMAPELFALDNKDPSKPMRYDGKKADMYSVGMVAFAIVTGTRPFGVVKEDERHFEKKISSGHRPPVWHLHPMIGKMLEKTWSGDPEKRCSFDILKIDLAEYENQGCPGWGGRYCCYSLKGASRHPISIMKKCCLKQNTQPIPLKY